MLDKFFLEFASAKSFDFWDASTHPPVYVRPHYVTGVEFYSPDVSQINSIGGSVVVVGSTFEVASRLAEFLERPPEWLLDRVSGAKQTPADEPRHDGA